MARTPTSTPHGSRGWSRLCVWGRPGSYSIGDPLPSRPHVAGSGGAPGCFWYGHKPHWWTFHPPALITSWISDNIALRLGLQYTEEGVGEGERNSVYGKNLNLKSENQVCASRKFTALCYGKIQTVGWDQKHENRQVDIILECDDSDLN